MLFEGSFVLAFATALGRSTILMNLAAGTVTEGRRGNAGCGERTAQANTGSDGNTLFDVHVGPQGLISTACV